MSNRRSVVFSGLMALALASMIILSGMLSGHLPSNQIPNSPPPTGITQPGSNSASGFGSVSLLLTDPPKIPYGVSAVYVSYDGVSFHEFGSGSPGTWVSIASSGTVEVLSLVNKSITIVNQNIPTGTYDQVAINITMVRVTYAGSNITVFSGSQPVSASIPGGINIYASTKIALLFDLQSSILNLNTDTSPRFVFNAAAWTAQLPVVAQKSLSQGKGQVINLSEQTWWPQIENIFTSRMVIVNATLTPDYLSVTVKNVGNTSIDLNFVTISTILQMHSLPRSFSPEVIGIPVGGITNTSLGFEYMPAFTGASVFLVLSNGSLVPISTVVVSSTISSPTVEPYSMLNPHSYLLQPGDEVTLSYSGPIRLFGGYQGGQSMVPIGILSNSFIVTVIGNNAVAAVLVPLS